MYFLLLRKELNLSGFEALRFYFQKATQVEIAVCFARTPLTCEIFVNFWHKGKQLSLLVC